MLARNPTPATEPAASPPRSSTPPPKSPARPNASRPSTARSAQRLAPAVRALGNDYSLLLVSGPTGVGKSVLLRELFGSTHATIESDGTSGSATPSWPVTATIISHVAQRRGGVAPATVRLSASGLNTVPQWLQPHATLSQGQQARADLALSIDSDTVIDGFGALVDTHTRQMLAQSIGRLVRKLGLRRVVVATTDASLCAFLQPDHVLQLHADRPPALATNPVFGSSSAVPRRPVLMAYASDAFDNEGGAAAAGASRRVEGTAPDGELPPGPSTLAPEMQRPVVMRRPRAAHAGAEVARRIGADEGDTGEWARAAEQWGADGAAAAGVWSDGGDAGGGGAATSGAFPPAILALCSIAIGVSSKRGKMS